MDWACSSASEVLCCHSGKNACLCAGRVSCIGHPYTSWAGERPSFREDVFRYCSSAQVSLFLSRDLPFHADWMISFMDLSGLGFRITLRISWWWGNMYKAPLFCKSWKAWDVNCGHTLSGTPVWQMMIWVMTRALWLWCWSSLVWFPASQRSSLLLLGNAVLHVNRGLLRFLVGCCFEGNRLLLVWWQRILT